MKLIGTAVTLACAGFGWAQVKQYVGTYEAIRFVQGRRVENKTLPAGQVMFLELHIDGNWVMRNMLIGYDGSWHMTGNKLVMITVNGPAGKITPPEKWILVPKPDRKRFVVISPRKLVGLIEFRYAPNIKAELTERMKSRI